MLFSYMTRNVEANWTQYDNNNDNSNNINYYYSYTDIELEI